MDWSPDSIMHCDKINLCLVIDTNILLSNLKSVMLIIDTPIPSTHIFKYQTILI